MRVDVLTLFPEAFGGPLDVSIIKRARDAGLLDLHLHDIREHATDRHRTVDDQPFGGGHGMVMKVDVLDAALQAAQAGAEPPAHVIYLSPQGQLLDDALVRELAAYPRLLPGALGAAASPREESFADGLLEHPQYTRPAEYRGWTVPDVLLSGHHAEIEKWKQEQRLRRTRRRRPDLLED